MSRPVGSAVAASSTVDLAARPRQRRARPTGPRRRTGSRRPGSRARPGSARITAPTWPVAPTTPTRRPSSTGSSSRSRRTRRPRPRRRRGRTPSCSGARRRCPARCRRQTTEMRISEVEIISMLTPASASALEERRRDARVRAHAGADQRHLADVVVVEQLVEADLVLQRVQRGHRAAARRRAGSVNEMSVLPSSTGDVLHDHVDVDLGVGDARGRSCAAYAGLVGHADDGDLGLAAVVRDAGDDGLFHGDVLHRCR